MRKSVPWSSAKRRTLSSTPTVGLALLIFAALGLLSTSPGVTLAATPRSDGVTTCYALLVGIADYEGTGSDLNYCDADATELKEALVTAPTWSSDNIRVLLNRSATKASIRTAVANLVSKADSDDLILFFYSGHGTQITDAAPVDESDNRDETLVATDLVEITDDELGAWLQPALCSKVVVLIDACFSGGFIRSASAAERLNVKTINTRRAERGSGFAEDILRALRRPATMDIHDNGVGVVLTASADDELSYESSLLEHGVFYYYLLEAIRRNAQGVFAADTNRNQWVSGEEAFAYLSPRILASQWDQTPQIYDANPQAELDFVGNVNVPPAPPRNVQAFDTPNDEGGSITITWSKSVHDGKPPDDVTGYSVLRATTAVGPFAVLIRLPKGSTSYVDNTTRDGINYWYKVQSHDAQYSTDSEVKGPVQSRDDTPPPPIDELTVADTPADQGGSITLSWYGYSPPSDFSYYRVYRAQATFSKVTDPGVQAIATITDVRQQYYVDGTTVDGTAYWYAVTAVDDTRDSIAPNGNELTTVTARGPVMSSPNFTFSFPPGKSIISIGVQALETDPGVLFGLTPSSSIEFACWDPAAAVYRHYSEEPTNPLFRLTLGKACWLSTPNPILLNVAGRPAPAGDVSVAVVPGWNMIGNPYTVDLDITGTTVTVGGETVSLSEAAKKGWVRDYMWGYDAFLESYRLISPTISFADRQIRRGRGVFFRSFVNATVTFARPADAAVSGQARHVAASAQVPVDWSFALTAESGAGADRDNFVGVSPQAETLNAITSPPALGIDLYFEPEPGVHSAALFARPGAQALTCTVKVWSAAAGPITLRWPDLSALPAGLRPRLTDLVTGRTVYLRTTSQYTYTQAAPGEIREFRLDVMPEATGALLVQTLAAAPSGRGAQIVLSLSRDAAVTVELINLAGRPIRTLAQSRAILGGQVATLTWDGRSNRGTMVPPGRYLVRVTAVAEDGQSASVARAVEIGR